MNTVIEPITAVARLARGILSAVEPGALPEITEEALQKDEENVKKFLLGQTSSKDIKRLLQYLARAVTDHQANLVRKRAQLAEADRRVAELEGRLQEAEARGLGNQATAQLQVQQNVEQLIQKTVKEQVDPIMAELKEVSAQLAARAAPQMRAPAAPAHAGYRSAVDAPTAAELANGGPQRRLPPTVPAPSQFQFPPRLGGPHGGEAHPDHGASLPTSRCSTAPAP
jgi:hypothetical protein